MKKVPFKASGTVSLGVELEFQIINPKTFGLVSRAKELIRNIKSRFYSEIIKPEITQSMIEINSSIHQTPESLEKEFQQTKHFMLEQGQQLGIKFCGGGTHPFQRWSMQKIFPSMRFKNLSRQYRYLSKRSTVFGLHIHIGCETGDDAIYLTHALARYVPQLITLSAASPFYQGIDTGYHSARSNVFTAYPLSGVMPFFKDWKEFSQYFVKMKKLGIVQSMKDFYWDIRPKPEFGTVEVRVCDTPLTICKAVEVSAYLQALSLYLLREKPVHLTQELYHLYGYNRFQAIRYGYEGHFVNPENCKGTTVAEDILETLEKIAPFAQELNSSRWIEKLAPFVEQRINDTTILRSIHKQLETFPKVVHEQCKIWETDQYPL